MKTAREMADEWTIEGLEAAIAAAIKAHAFEDVEVLLHLMVLKDPRRAAVVYDVIGLAIDMRRGNP